MLGRVRGLLRERTLQSRDQRPTQLLAAALVKRAHLIARLEAEGGERAARCDEGRPFSLEETGEACELRGACEALHARVEAAGMREATVEICGASCGQRRPR